MILSSHAAVSKLLQRSNITSESITNISMLLWPLIPIYSGSDKSSGHNRHLTSPSPSDWHFIIHCMISDSAMPTADKNGFFWKLNIREYFQENTISQRPFFSLAENQFSRKTFFFTRPALGPPKFFCGILGKEENRMVPPSFQPCHHQPGNQVTDRPSLQCHQKTSSSRQIISLTM